MAGKILIVDDDQAILTMLDKAIRSNGYETDLCINGEDALSSISANSYDLILLDVNMPGINGFEVTQAIRQNGIATPIVIISGRKENLDTVYGLDIGADDYITKPLNPITLNAKIKALIRRSKGDLTENSNIMKAGPFTYNTSTLRFYKNDVEIPLSSKENSIMKLFIDNPNRIFSKDMIYDMVWGEAVIDENAIMVYINRLRQKIEDEPRSPKYIQNVRGLGYRFVV